jgi:hypothetical protein
VINLVKQDAICLLAVSVSWGHSYFSTTQENHRQPSATIDDHQPFSVKTMAAISPLSQTSIGRYVRQCWLS